MRTFITALVATAVLTVLTGIIYPLAVFGIAQTIFPRQAGGSIIVASNKVVGSSLIGQNFSSPKYFQSRPSAAGDKGYDASNSGGSNLGPTNKALIDAVKLRLKNLVESNPGIDPRQVPIDLVTASGSGLDPEISPAAAEPAGCTGCPRPRSERRSGAAVDCRQHAATIGGNFRRTRGERPAVEPGPRSRGGNSQRSRCGKSWQQPRDLNER